MERQIIDIPRVFMRAMSFDWDIDWRGQSAGEGNEGEQIVFNRQPRFIGSPQLVLGRDMLPYWRALRARAEGRRNAWRVAMVDPLGFSFRRGSYRADWAAWLSGNYVEPRPQILCAGAAAAGASSILVDERMAERPVRVGAFLSHADWPFLVIGRSTEGTFARLEVKMLRRAIPAGAAIDLEARGLFIGTSDTMGAAPYTHVGLPRTQLELIEWITRP